MWNKIYVGVLGLAFLLMFVLTYLTFSWLQSVDKPVNVVANYDYYSNICRTFLWVSSLLLLILANVVLWKMRKSWALWATLLYFAVFTLTQTFWVAQTFFQYKQSNNLTHDSFSLSPVFGVTMIVLAGIIVFFNQYLVKRLHDKTFTEQQPAGQLPNDVLADENEVNNSSRTI